MTAGMQEVCCRDCGCSLGWQTDNVEIDWEMWVHNRCPVRIARGLGMEQTEYETLFALCRKVIESAYPDFPPKARSVRAGIAAGALLEAMSHGYLVGEFR